MCPGLGQRWSSWDQVTVRFPLTTIIVKGWFFSVPEVGAGEMWQNITSLLVPGSLCVVDQVLVRVVSVPELDPVLVCSTRGEFSMHIFEYPLQFPIIIGFVSGGSDIHKMTGLPWYGVV